ncbi:MAG: AI-2E family transporter [Phaeodactylibacter sp.]|nr:AI-2E family transporter [Phaeodactylibacter sp.]MCB9276875.1 AI-2E family transporter [Lewinellaceae bacterium]
MENISINLQRIAFLMIIVLAGGYLAIAGQSLLAPLAFSSLFSFLLLPICRRIERYISYRPGAILLSMAIALVPVAVGITFFSFQFSTVLVELPDITGKLQQGVEQIFFWLQQRLHTESQTLEEWLGDNLTSFMDMPLRILGESLSSSTYLLGSIILTALFTFFMLLYRTSIKNFLLAQIVPENREEANFIVRQVRRLVQEYLYGMLLVILILAVLNSFGLWLIGIKYAAFWGSLAACLAIIPYIGTTLGGLLPFVYALATTGTLWQPAAVVLLYTSVQTLEGNFITPKVVGNSVSINPLAAILSLFLGGLMWGIAGLILALPVAAVVKVIFEHITPLKPVSELLSSGLYRNSGKFLEEYDEDKYRIGSYFRENNEKR